jgi:hypothetical protein
VCGIKLDNPEVLLEALSFKGEQHTPGYTYVDRATEEDVVVLRLKEQSASFGSREAGKGLKKKIVTLARTSSGKIILDLMDVPLISSSFADEVFGKIFSELGPMNFMAKIQIVGGNAVVRQLIDRAIAQRMALLAKPSP